ncbi:MAG: MFS transporter [Synergistaceae bacterium]|nr:MFS transporter [Synergistaceae bacterium]
MPVTDGLSRRILIVLSLAMFCAMLGMGIISPILPLYAKNLGASGFALGMIIGAFSLSRSGGMIVSGELAEHMDKKRLLLGGLAFYAAASVSYTFANSTASLILIRMGHGLGSAMVVPITMAIATDIAPEGEAGLFFGSLQGAQFLGVGCGPLLSGLLAENFGLMAPFYGMTALTILSMTFVFLWLPWKISSGSSVSTSMGAAFSAILLDREMMRVFFFQFASAMCRGVLVMVIPLFASGFNLSFMQIGFVISLNSLATGFLSVSPGGWRTDFPSGR